MGSVGKTVLESKTVAESVTSTKITTQESSSKSQPKTRISRDYNNRDDKINELRNNQTVTYNANKAPADVFKSNGLGDVVYHMSRALNKGDIIEITSDKGNHNSTILITQEYSNGNRGFTVVYGKKQREETIQRYLKEGTTRNWRDITEGAAWLDYRDKYKLKVKKAK